MRIFPTPLFISFRILSLFSLISSTSRILFLLSRGSCSLMYRKTLSIVLLMDSFRRLVTLVSSFSLILVPSRPFPFIQLPTISRAPFIISVMAV